MPPARIEDSLAPYAQRSADTRGRRHEESEHPYRSPYQRDRDRIIHSRAFRRLEYKTQVFVNHEGDHFRTRLTHTIEVSQIGRTVSAALGLNMDLVESLALSHDLGHTPFGHLGEDVLDEMLVDHGGFDHNRQSLRIVEHLEERYPGFPGLNLTWEVREGIAKHSAPIDPVAVPEFSEYDPARQPPVEAQMIDLVDEIAYNHHDVDDGLESRLLHLDGLVADVPLFSEAFGRAVRRYDGADPRMLANEALRGVINLLVTDLIDQTRRNLEDAGVRSSEDVRDAGRSLVGLSEPVHRANAELKRYLRQNLYRHHRIERMKDKARRILEALFRRYLENPLLLPEHVAARIGDDGPHRTVADYIAGMTDRFAMEEYMKLFDAGTRV